MFTKMLVIVDGDVNIHDQWEVAKYISENVDPLRDVSYSQGPTDVLDHSCSTMAFGGKMGVDATQKHVEELLPNSPKVSIDFDALKNSINSISTCVQQFSELKDVNVKLLLAGIPIVFVSIEKNKKGHVKEVAKNLFSDAAFACVKMLIFLEHTMDISDIADAVWRFSNNFDPRRDHFDFPSQNEIEVNHVAYDGTRKLKEFDDFHRDWPNILVSDQKTIERVDAIWDKLGLGKFIKSPSLKYSQQLYKGGAVAE